MQVVQVIYKLFQKKNKKYFQEKFRRRAALTCIDRIAGCAFCSKHKQKAVEKFTILWEVLMDKELIEFLLENKDNINRLMNVKQSIKFNDDIVYAIIHNLTIPRKGE